MDALATERYLESEAVWPASGWHVVVQYDDDSVVVYQANRPQLGLRGEALRLYGREWVLGIRDISDFVAAPRSHARPGYDDLVGPRGRVDRVADAEVAARLGVVAAGAR